MRTRLVEYDRGLLERALAGAPDRASLVVNLFDDVQFTSTDQHVENARSGHRTWVGTSRDNTDTAALTLGPAGLAGQALVAGRAYTLESLADGRVRVREVPVGAPSAELGAVALPTRDAALGAPRAAGDDGPVAIDLLVLYTPSARDREGGTAAITSTLAGAVAVTNAAFARSGVAAVLTTSGPFELPYVESAAGIAADLDAMSPGGALHASVTAWRQATRADLVALVVGRPNAASGCGVAYLGPSPGAVYSVTEAACLFAGQWTFSHEIAHNLGADHAPGDPIVSPVPYARGYRSPSVRTLMAYAVPGAPARVLNFSSATVVEPPGSGAATGTALQDNARRLGETAATVAAYVARLAPPDPPEGLSAAVAGGGVTVTWRAPAVGSAVDGFALDAESVAGGASFGPFLTTAYGIHFPAVVAGRYRVRVRSLGPGGVSVPADELTVEVSTSCAVPGPADVTAEVGAGLVTLRWQAGPGDGPTTYEVGLGSAPGLLDLGVFGVGALTGATLPAPPGRYVVRARGVNACGPGAASPELTVVVP